MIEFRLYFDPPTVSHHDKHIATRGRTHMLADTQELVAAKRELELRLQPWRPATPLTGPVALDLEFTWPWFERDTKRTREANYRIPHDTKPDLSNVTKTFEDCLARLGFFENDSRVVRLVQTKWRGWEPGVGVILSPFINATPAGVTTHGTT